MCKTTPLSALLFAAALPVFAQAPPNDTRATATALVADRAICIATVGSTAQATASGVTPSCAPASQTAPARDLWYSFVASQPAMTVYAEIGDGPNNQLRVEVTDAAGAVVDCGSFSYSEAVRRLDDLAVGDTYAVQLSHTAPNQANELRVCAFETPACLPVNSVSTRNGQNWTIVTWQTEGTPPALGYRVVAGPRRNFNPAVDTPVAAADVPDGNTTRVVLWNLEPGVAYDYFVQAVCSDTERSTFVGPIQNFTQEAPGTPENDSLTAGRGPEILPSISRNCIESPGSTRFATAGDGPVGDCATAGPDVWYELNYIAPAYTFEVKAANGTTADLALEAYTYEFEKEDDGGFVFAPARIACANAAGPGGAESFTIAEAVVPETNGRRRVLVRVIATDGAPSDFTLCGYQVAAEEPPAVFEPAGCAPTVLATFDGTGAPGALIDVLTDEGQIICAIENTEDLGELSVTAYGHTGDLRTAGSEGVPYANRNVAIDVERQPTAPVRVRFYLSVDDLAALIAADAFPDNGRATLDELLAVARVPATSCSSAFPGGAAAVSFVGAGPYGTDAYYVDVRVPNFSEFFFSDIDAPLPTTLVSVAEASPAASLVAFPNPASASVRVTLPQNPGDAGQDYRVSLVDATGRAVRTVLAEAAQPQAVLDVAQLPSGVYVLRAVGTRDGSAASARLLVR